MKTTQLSSNNTEVEKWLANQPDPTSFSKRYTFEEIKQFLVEFLNPEEEAPKKESIDDAAAEAAAALTSSMFALSFSSLLQSVMVRNVLSPVTVIRILVAPCFFIAGQKPLAASTASSTFPSNSQSVNETNILSLP